MLSRTAASCPLIHPCFRDAESPPVVHAGGLFLGLFDLGPRARPWASGRCEFAARDRRPRILGRAGRSAANLISRLLAGRAPTSQIPWRPSTPARCPSAPVLDGGSAQLHSKNRRWVCRPN